MISILVLLFAMVSVNTATASGQTAKSLYLHTGDAKIYLTDAIPYYIDTDGQTTISDLLSAPDAFVFNSHPGRYFNVARMNRDRHPVWLRLDVVNGEPFTPIIVEVETPRIRKIEFYSVKDNKVVRRKLSTVGRRSDQQRIRFHNHIYRTDLDRHGNDIIYVRLTNTVSMTAPIILWDLRTFFIHQVKSVYLYGLCYGLLFLTVILFLMLAAIKRSRSFLYYGLFVLNVGIFLACQFGHIIYLFPNTNFDVGLFNVMFSMVAAVCSLLFLYRFLLLYTMRYSVMALTVFVLCIAEALLFFLAMAIPIGIATMLANILVIVNIATILGVAIRRIVQRHKAARFFLMAWSCQMICVVIAMLYNADIINGTGFTHNSILIGQIILVLSMNYTMMHQIIATQRDIMDFAQRFVPREFITLLNKKQIQHIGLGDQIEMPMTVLFSDIRNYTKLSEGMSPKENFAFVNSYFSRMGPYVRNNHGFIDKYIGDAIMALFTEGADYALQAAVDMFNELHLYNQHRNYSHYPAINIGIGIHTGNVMLGVVGDKQRMDTSVISDAVNLAAKMETATKQYGAPTLFTAEVLTTLTYPERFHFRKVAILNPIKGSDVMIAYELLDCYRDEPLRNLLIDNCAYFEEGIEAIVAGNIYDARMILHEIRQDNPFDRVALAHLDTLDVMAQRGTQIPVNGLVYQA